MVDGVQAGIMHDLWLDLRYSLRIIRQSPGFALTAILALALGIGASTAMFTVLDHALLRPLPYAQPDRLVWIGIKFPSLGLGEELLPGADYVEWSERNHVFDGIAGYSSVAYDFAPGGEPERIGCGQVTQNFFAVLGVNPVVGRAFLPAEDLPNGSKAVILTDALWRRRFSADRSVIGKTVRMNGEPYEVVGVMGSGFRFPGEANVEAIIAQQIDRPAQLARSSMRILRTIARLKQGVTIGQAKAELSTFLDDTRRQFGKLYRSDNMAVVIPLEEHETAKTRLILVSLMAAVGLVHLIACVNVANLLLARAATRRREIAVRAALGAGRARLLRQLLTESVVLSVAGMIPGLVLAAGALKLLVWMDPDGVPRLNQLTIDGRILAFALGAALVTAVVFGLAPALSAGSVNLTDAMKQGDRRTGSGGGGRLCAALVVAELSMSLVVLAGAALLLESLWRLSNAPLGFDSDRVLTTQITLGGSEYGSKLRRLAFWREMTDRVSGIPGVESVSLSGGLPPERGPVLAIFSRSDAPPPEQGHRGDSVSIRPVSPGYFRAMRIPLRQGRFFGTDDSRQDIREAVVNETLARKYFANEDPIGKRIMGHIGNSWRTIVGVAADAKNEGLGGVVAPEMYQPYWLDNGNQFLTLAVRSVVRPENLVPVIREQVRTLNPAAPLKFKTMDENLSTLRSKPRFNAVLFGVFAGLALVLAALGTYGVLSYWVAQRTREIGIRLALGAEPLGVARMVASQALWLAGLGVAIGLAGAFAVTRYLSTLLFEVKPNDPSTFALVAGILMATAILAAWLPARRATQVDPAIALRCE